MPPNEIRLLKHYENPCSVHDSRHCFQQISDSRSLQVLNFADYSYRPSYRRNWNSKIIFEILKQYEADLRQPSFFVCGIVRQMAIPKKWIHKNAWTNCQQRYSSVYFLPRWSSVEQVNSLLRPRERLRSIVMSMSVCGSVGLSVCLRGYLRNDTRDLCQFYACCLCP